MRARGAARPLPVDGRLAVLNEVIVSQREMVVAEESAIGTQRRGMGRGEDKMARAVHDCPFALGITAPEDEHEAFALGRQAGYDGIGEAFPTAPLVRTCLMGSHGQRGLCQPSPRC